MATPKNSFSTARGCLPDRTLAACLLFILLAGSSAAATPGVLAGDEAERIRLECENAELEAEISVAGSPSVYAVLSFAEKKIFVKSRGMVLGEFPFASIVSQGTLPSPGPFKLEKKTSFREPKRTEIAPGEAGVVNATMPEFLDFHDMPARYRLSFDGGVEVTIAPAPGGKVSAMGSWLGDLGWRIRCFFKALIARVIRKGPAPAFMRTALAEDDARALYWAAPENSRWIFSASATATAAGR